MLWKFVTYLLLFTEYALYDYLARIPGSYLVLPYYNEWKNYSITHNIKKMIRGERFSVMRFSFKPLIDITAGAKVYDKEDLRLFVEYRSDL